MNPIDPGDQPKPQRNLAHPKSAEDFDRILYKIQLMGGGK